MILDTHVWLWYLTDSDALSQGVKDQIDASPDSFFLSAISIWEACLLAERGRILFSEGGESFRILRQLLREVPIRVAELNSEIALLSRELKFVHSDPADRFIAATAAVYNLPLVTADDNLIKLKWLKTVKP